MLGNVFSYNKHGAQASCRRGQLCNEARTQQCKQASTLPRTTLSSSTAFSTTPSQTPPPLFLSRFAAELRRPQELDSSGALLRSCFV